MVFGLGSARSRLDHSMSHCPIWSICPETELLFQQHFIVAIVARLYFYFLLKVDWFYRRDKFIVVDWSCLSASHRWLMSGRWSSGLW